MVNRQPTGAQHLGGLPTPLDKAYAHPSPFGTRISFMPGHRFTGLGIGKHPVVCELHSELALHQADRSSQPGPPPG